ncbi:hypothetical protein CRG98_005436 [Punica granatum]|uniref:Uncharacterized protein n=1 Tax=Punica granatum TaxID=22663 RepID=A0A2I0L0E6_PUNGR|nr:hypothetical protein CRG98_005436 [Punica granatum]
MKKFNSPSSTCTCTDWSAFLKIFEVGTTDDLQEYAKFLNLDIIDKASSVLGTELAYVYELVIGVIDERRTKEKGYETMVKESFCDELDELRQIYEELPEFLEQDI